MISPAYLNSVILKTLETENLLPDTRQSLSFISNRLEEAAKVSPALDVMRKIWDNKGAESWLKLNQSLFNALRSIIEVGVDFAESDFSTINKEMRGHFWFGVSQNGHHIGEGLYKAACESNMSAAKSYEKSFGRKPFLLGGKRVFEGFKVKYKNLYCHVTGWGETNDKIRFVGYENRTKEGKKKLFEMDSAQWNAARKEMTNEQ